MERKAENRLFQAVLCKNSFHYKCILLIILVNTDCMITNDFNKELRSISDALRDLGYTDSTIGLRQTFWKSYYDFNGSFDIDEQSMDAYLSECHGIVKGNINIPKRQYEARAAIRNLLEYRNYGKIINYHTPWFKDLPWVESYKDVVDVFFEHLKSNEYKAETVIDYERTVKKLTNFLHSVGIESFRDLNPRHITSFLVSSVNRSANNLKSLLSNLRVLFRYLYLNKYNEEDLSLFLPKTNVLMKRKHIPSTWTREDVSKILFCIDVANPIGKRDYAIILLVARLGLRVSDVIRLSFGNIKWDKNCIQLSQYKTNEPLVLPLFDDVGNALIDYIKNGRPQTDTDRIFVKHNPPFSQFSESNHLYNMFNKYLLKSGIVVTPEKNHGLHSLRHSLATELLRNEVPLPVISEILGHRSLETTMQYLRADTEQLRYCTLIEGENYANQS
jgi:site-specific recombinase XerD